MPVGATRGRRRQAHAEPPGEAGHRDGLQADGFPSILNPLPSSNLHSGRLAIEGWLHVGSCPGPQRRAQAREEAARPGLAEAQGWVCGAWAAGGPRPHLVKPTPEGLARGRFWPRGGAHHTPGASGGCLRALPEGEALSGQNSPWAAREEGGGEVGWAARGNPRQMLRTLGLPQAGLTPSTSPAPYFAQATALTRMTSSAAVRGSVKTPFTMRKPRQPTCLWNLHGSQHVAGAPFSSLLGPNPAGPLLHMRQQRHRMVE